MGKSLLRPTGMLQKLVPSAVVVFLAACGGAGDATGPTTGSDASADASPSTDASTQLVTGDAAAPLDSGKGATDGGAASAVWTVPTDPPDCDPLKPFGARVLVEGLPAAQLSPVGGTIYGGRVTFSPDERTIFFAQRTPGTADDARIMIAERAKRSDAFGTARVLINGGPATTLSDPTVTTDGLTLYFKDWRTYGTWKLTRPNVQSTFGSEVLFALGPSTFSNGEHIFVTGDGSQIFGLISLPAPNFLFRFSATPPGNVGVQETNTNADVGYGAGNVRGFALSADGRTIIYAKSLNSAGDGKYYSAKRATAAESFGPGVELSEFGTMDLSHSSIPEWLSADTCRLYRLDVIPGGNHALFVSSRGK